MTHTQTERQAEAKPNICTLKALRSALLGAIAWSFIAPTAVASFGSGLSAQEARLQLVDLEQLPFFLSTSAGNLIASSEQLSPNDISEPSLSWIRDQLGKRYGSDRLVAQWQAYQTATSAAGSISYVDVVVDEQIWSLLSYFERYAFISQFGTVAKQYGYHLRVFHSGDVANFRDAQSSGSSRLALLRGAHVCSFQSVPASTPAPLGSGAASDIPCEIVLNDAGRRRLL